MYVVSGKGSPLLWKSTIRCKSTCATDKLVVAVKKNIIFKTAVIMTSDVSFL